MGCRSSSRRSSSGSGPRPCAAVAFACATLAGALLSCDREERRFEEIPAFGGYEGRVDTLPPGIGDGPPKNPYEKNAWAISQGKLYYEWYSCATCHAKGGGGDIGPALMDDRWRYGSEPVDIYTSIMNGRPNGMPPFRGRIASYQAWQIAAYVRSMSGLVPKDAAPGRSEGMSAKKPESMQEERPPRPPEGGRR